VTIAQEMICTDTQRLVNGNTRRAHAWVESVAFVLPNESGSVEEKPPKDDHHRWRSGVRWRHEHDGRVLWNGSRRHRYQLSLTYTHSL
jgi:hypothetical protein